MSEWLNRAASFLEEDTPVILVTVCGVEGSTPRERGAKMLVTRNRQWGTIGGGALEFSAIDRARAMLSGERERIYFDEFPLGPALGQCCGGRALLLYEALAAVDIGWLQRAAQIVASGGIALLERALSDAPGGKTDRRVASADASSKSAPALSLMDHHGASISTQIPGPSECARICEYVMDERARVYIFGAGHVGNAIADILTTMPASVTWIDRRDGCFPEIERANLTLLQSSEETQLAKTVPPGACCFVLTHDHQLDYELTKAILESGASAYCGLIGSRTKRARFEQRLQRTGFTPSQLEHLSCPIGGSGLESKLPALIALGAVQEMFLAHQHYMKTNTQ